MDATICHVAIIRLTQLDCIVATHWAKDSMGLVKCIVEVYSCLVRYAFLESSRAFKCDYKCNLPQRSAEHGRMLMLVSTHCAAIDAKYMLGCRHWLPKLQRRWNSVWACYIAESYAARCPALLCEAHLAVSPSPHLCPSWIRSSAASPLGDSCLIQRFLLKKWYGRSLTICWKEASM
jgi:hypothetical protein